MSTSMSRVLIPNNNPVKKDVITTTKIRHNRNNQHHGREGIFLRTN